MALFKTKSGRRKSREFRASVLGARSSCGGQPQGVPRAWLSRATIHLAGCQRLRRSAPHAGKVPHVKSWAARAWVRRKWSSEPARRPANFGLPHEEMVFSTPAVQGDGGPIDLPGAHHRNRNRAHQFRRTLEGKVRERRREEQAMASNPNLMGGDGRGPRDSSVARVRVHSLEREPGDGLSRGTAKRAQGRARAVRDDGSSDIQCRLAEVGYLEELAAKATPSDVHPQRHPHAILPGARWAQRCVSPTRQLEFAGVKAQYGCTQ